MLALARNSFHLSQLETLYQDTAPGVVQQEGICLHTQTFLIITAFLFDFLLRFF